MTDHHSFCRICIAGCGTIVTVEHNRVVAVAGDPDHPFSQGYLCPKGRALGDALHRDDRLDGGLIRREGTARSVGVDGLTYQSVTMTPPLESAVISGAKDKVSTAARHR